MQCYRAPIACCPEEVLTHIFSYLSVHERLVVSLVCKQWLQVINCNELLKDICIVFKNRTTKGIKIFSSMSRTFSCFEFNEVLIDDKCCIFLKHFGLQIHDLSFINCQLSRGEIDNLSQFDSFNNLKILKILNCDVWCLFPSLPNLIELHLYDSAMLSDYDFVQLGNTMPNLKVITFSINISFNPKVYNRYYTDGNNINTNPSSMVLSFPAIENFISKRTNTIESLDFSYSSISTPGLIQLSKINNLKIQRISLTNALDCTEGLVEFCKNQPTLKSLDLSALHNMTDEILQSLCVLVPDVEEMNIRSANVTNDTLRKLFHLKSLQKLGLSSCKKITSSGFLQAVADCKSFRLKALNLSGCDIEATTITELLKRCKYLVSLDLSTCCVTDENIHMISENLIMLKQLNLSRCCEISDQGLAGTLNVENREASCYNTEIIARPISNLKSLKELNLSGCDKLTDIGVIEAIQFQELQYLNINKCQNVSVNALRIVIKQNPNLVKLIWRDQLIVTGILRRNCMVSCSSLMSEFI